MSQLLAERLRLKAEGFADDLTKLVRSTVSMTGEFIVTPYEEDERPKAWIFPPDSVLNRPRPINLDVGCSKDQECPLWLGAMFVVDLTDDDDEHLRVLQSVFALWINPDTRRPAIRIEYDRELGSEPDDDSPGHHGRSAAHAQVHGSSQELSWAYGRLGRQVRPLEKIHIPVGGRRFRPSLEDFIEFLHVHDLLPGVLPTWKNVLAEHRHRWQRLQLKAAIRNDSETAAVELQRLGWTVSPDAITPPPATTSDGGKDAHS